MNLFAATLLLTAVAVSAQLGGWGSWIWQGIRDRYENRDVIDTLHSYRFVEHSTSASHLLIAISDDRNRKECFVVEVDKGWVDMLQDHNYVSLIVEEIYHMIMDPNLPASTITTNTLTNRYHDLQGAEECEGHRIFIINYSPSFAPSTILWPTDEPTTPDMASTTHHNRPIG